MDRDLAINDMAQRQLQAELNSVSPGSAAHNEITQALEDLKNGDLHITPESHPNLTQMQQNNRLVVGVPDGSGGSVLNGGQWQVGNQPMGTEDIRDLAQHYYDRSYMQATGGRDPVTSLQGVTGPTSNESYHDLNVLGNNPQAAPFDPLWADQTGSVTSVKGYEATGGGGFANDPWNAYQEVARGTAKDIDSKLLPLLQTNNAPPEFIAQVQDMRSFLNDVKAGNLSPSQAQAAAQARFGTDIQGLTNRVDSAIAATIKFGPPPPTGWSAVSPSNLASSAAGTAAQGVSGVVGSPPTQIKDESGY